MKIYFHFGLGLLVLSLFSCQGEKPEGRIVVKDLEQVHAALALLLNETAYQAGYSGMLGRATNQGGLQQDHEHGWSIYDRNSYEISAVIRVKEVLDPEWNEPIPHTFVYNSLKLGLVGDTDMMAITTEGEIRFSDLVKILEDISGVDKGTNAP